ncbi:MAG: DUF3347 domain-containing protein [Chitinophagia bacterium]|nr:DUF3347 domain-containing protein [Chitinophagia bacterium]
MSRFNLIVVFSFAIVGFASCDQPVKPVAAPEAKTAGSNLDSSKTKAILVLVNDYLRLKDALVATNSVQTKAAAATLAASAQALRTNMAADSASLAALLASIDTVAFYSTKISSMPDDPHCETQRIAFSPLSNSIFELLHNAGVKNAGLYREYCPMALNDSGAYWLSREEEIKNPYFGKKMLECGEVKDSL